MRIKIFMFQKDDTDILEEWIVYHSYLFGTENLVVVDHDSKPNSLHILEDYGVQAIRFDGPFVEKASFLSEVMNEYREGSDLLIPIDVDEFICAADGKGFLIDKEEILSRLSLCDRDDTRYKMSDYTSVLTSTEIFSPIDDITRFVESSQSRYMNVRSGDQIVLTDMRKTFYPASTFVKTDQGNHYGKISSGSGRVQDSGIGLVHFTLRGYEHFLRKYGRWPEAYGDSHSQKGRHWRSVYKKILSSGDPRGVYLDMVKDREGSFEDRQLKDLIAALVTEIL